MPDRVLVVSGLGVVDRRTDPPQPVVEHFDLTVRAGESVALTGLHPADRTTLLDVLAGLAPPAAGSVTIHPPQGNRPHHHVRPVGYVPATAQLLPVLTAVENVALALAASGRVPADAWARAEHVLGRLGLPPGAWHNAVEQLSGGQQQRVAVARALVDRPALLVADDPTSELDPSSAALVFTALFAAVADGSALVLVTDSREATDACTRRVSAALDRQPGRGQAQP